jgi:hypothetical protein
LILVGFSPRSAKPSAEVIQHDVGVLVCIRRRPQVE